MGSPENDTPPSFDNQPTPAEAERWLKLKDDLLDRFGQLPPEHQATIGLVLVKTILEGEQGTWFRDALTAKLERGDTATVAPYILSVTHDHLRQVQVSEEELAQLSDADLATIASLIHEHYITDAFWDELAFITDLVLAGKKGKPESGASPVITSVDTAMTTSHAGDETFPVSSLSKEDLLFARPDLKDEIATLSPSDMQRLAEKVGDALQDTYWDVVGIVLDRHFPERDEEADAPDDTPR